MWTLFFKLHTGARGTGHDQRPDTRPIEATMLQKKLEETHCKVGGIHKRAGFAEGSSYR